MGLRLGDTAPDFAAPTTQGDIHFHDWIGDSWAVLFSHPADFTPVCTTELGAVARLTPEFAKRGVKVIGLSVDSLNDHREWIHDINQVNKVHLQFPIIADSDRRVSTLYDMLDSEKHDPTNVKDGLPYTVRSVFIIDPKKTIRLILTYPASCGRNFDEILRAVDSLQLSDRQPITTPADWQPGNDVIIHPKVTDQEADKLFPGYKALKSYLRMTHLNE
ncbi:peroxiredoxin 1 [Dispira parvispora]|uniref:Peroxiredoxin 1 n=1 Tax=Dispira parvispora TaxID=1520584 RepID=A0A9W8AMW2_9FUNG|nr:peroxiredoxin 1 [Dispira parvispora]